MHSWGDDFKYFEDVGQCAEEIGAFCVRWGRIGVTSTKEKYGTVRVYCVFGLYSLHSLLFPRFVFRHPSFPLWLYRLDSKIMSPAFQALGRPLVWYQIKIYRLAYRRALKRYPHIKEEILSDADYPEYLEGLAPLRMP